MTKIVLSKLDRIDMRTTLAKINILKTADLPKEREDTIFVLAATDENLEAVGNDSDQVYIPATQLTSDNQSVNGLHIYFDLENYPFYQKAKEIIEKAAKPKGVFRFRRMVKQGENASLLIGDLYVLSSLLGEAQDIQVKKTDQSVTPSHTIIMMNFGGGTMAHIEYTVTDRERIELEWSGIKNIIEFDSDEMRPIQPSGNTQLPLSYSVDSIVATAHKVDQTLVDRLNHFSERINGGADK